MGRGPRAAARLLLALLLPLTIGLCWVAPTGPAQAAEPTAYVTVALESMDPALPEADGTVRLRGSVTNTSDLELSNLQVAFWRSFDPIQSAEGMQVALDSAANQPLGARVNGGGLFQNIPSDTDRTLAPGESTRFDLTADVADLRLSGGDAVYLIGVHIRGRTESDGPDITLGRARIFMPLVGTEPANALRMTTVVVITSRPSWVSAGVLADDHLATELAAGGRLRALLETAAREDVSFAVDPALVQEVTTMSQGYRVRSLDGQTAPGSGQAAAAGWLRDLGALIEDGDGFQLPYGNPDVAALVHQDRADLLDAAVQAGAGVELTEDLPLLVLPADGRADAATIAAAEKLDPRVILVSDTSAKGAGPLLQPPDANGTPTGTAPLVSYTSAALQGGPGPAPTGTAVKVRQRMLADTWLEASTATAGSTVGRVRLVTTASQASATDPESAVAWMKPSTLSDLLAGAPSAWDGELRYPASARRAELSPEALAAVNDVARDYQTYAELLVEPATVTAEARGVVARAVSASWRGDPTAQAAYLDPVASRVERVVTEGVVLSANPRVLTTGRDATFPITVRNQLPADPDADGNDRNSVAVRIEFRSSNAQRLSVAPLQVPDGIVGQASTTQNVAVSAKANGTVVVVAQVVTTSGRPVGRPLRIEVNATQAGTTGWIIAIAAGIVLIGSTALRIKQVARERSAAGAPVVVSRPPDDAETARDRESLDV